MKETYTLSLTEVLKSEGGYVNHPADPGGATNKGITQATYDSYRRSKGLITRKTVKLIADSEVADIYKSRYWDAVKGDELPAGLDYAVFDYAVNSGPQKAIKSLQKALGLTADGQLGPMTLAACRKSPEATIKKLCASRLAFLKGLKTWPTFGKGWERRVNAVEKTALKLGESHGR